MNTQITRALSALAIAGTLFGGAWMGTAAAHAHDPFSQDTFPCAEDEVLGYAPEFGADRVGCIHVDDVR